jgi:predicted branched-subunit amino acid permease
MAGPGTRATISAAAPIALAIGVFGVVFGAAAIAHVDPALVVAMSLLVFSGSLQFALIGVLATGAGPLALLLTALALNLRHLVLGAVIRPRLTESPLRRAAVSAFLVDESFGLALASGRDVAKVLVVSGAMFYTAWQVGTVLGVLGAQLVAIEELAAAVFPILFIGLAAVTSQVRADAYRAVVAASAVLLLSVLVPQLYAFLPIIAAIVVALPLVGEK